jgi:hypothetical protein
VPSCLYNMVSDETTTPEVGLHTCCVLNCSEKMLRKMSGPKNKGVSEQFMTVSDEELRDL